MTSLEGVPRRAVVGADLPAGVTGGSRDLPLLTLANSTAIKVSPLPGSLPRGWCVACAHSSGGRRC
jgi:hypothetical protein